MTRPIARAGRGVDPASPEFLTYYAGVLTREAEARAGTEFAAWLMECAGRALAQAQQGPAQPDLFKEQAA